MNRTIDRAIQEAILELLPDDAIQACSIMAQLLANIILSQELHLEEFLEEIRQQYRAYVIEDTKF